MKRLLFLLILTISATVAFDAQQKAVSPLEQRADDVIEIVNNPPNLERTPAPEMPAQIQADRLRLLRLNLRRLRQNFKS